MEELIVKCPICNGSGTVPLELEGHPHVSVVVDCRLCKGKGRLTLEVIEVKE